MTAGVHQDVCRNNVCSQAFLHLLLKISESITRLESLLLISAPSDDDQGRTELHGVTLTSHHEEDRVEERQYVSSFYASFALDL